MTILETAIAYHKAGFQPIPLHPKSKKPVNIKWQNHSFHRLTRKQVIASFDNPDYNIGIVTGPASGILVVDLDIKHAANDPALYLEAQEGVQSFLNAHPSPLIAQTGTDGYHVFYKYVSGTKNRVDILPELHLPFKIDIRSERGFVVAAPSIHPETLKPYRWIKGNEHNLEDLFTIARSLKRPPAEIINASYESSSGARKPKDWRRRFEAIPDGQRHKTMTEVVGLLLNRLPPQQWDAVVWPLTLAWNEKYAKPPLDERECRQIFEGLSNKEFQNYAVRTRQTDT